jgi:hypothetical protein
MTSTAVVAAGEVIAAPTGGITAQLFRVGDADDASSKGR